MTKIQQLAADLALLSNHSLAEIADCLVRDYPTRAEAFERSLSIAQQEQLQQLHRELGVEPA